MPIGYVWQTFLETPLINVMVALTAICFSSFGLAILVFTILSRVLLFPLTLRMLNSMKALQAIQPQMQELQKKYSDPKRRQEETMRLYKEAGVNPLGCLSGQLIQMPLFIALYQVIRVTLGGSPESVLDLSGRLYDVPFIQDQIPLSRQFIGMDLGANGGIPLLVLVFIAMWLQQRISSSRTTSATVQSEQQRQTAQMMQWMMPAVFSWFVLFSPAGVGIYWFASTVIGIALQWVFVGPGDFTWGSLVPNIARARLGMAPLPGTSTRVRHSRPAAERGTSETGNNDASSGNKRSNSRRSGGEGAGPTRPAPGSGRNRRRHRG
ncbi:MAG: YidC/Oxa1 family membrane protein insertase [Dehalococcoidia bacterium]|nr:MAG: YidC/Oxa1 family membrane protein insertase [Dehalococcoidia bacterium]